MSQFLQSCTGIIGNASKNFCIMQYPVYSRKRNFSLLNYSKKVKRFVWRILIARSASLSSITHEILISLAPVQLVSIRYHNHLPKNSRRLTLRNHLNIDVILAECRKHFSCNTDHILHLLAHQTQNRHFRYDIHRSVFP